MASTPTLLLKTLPILRSRIHPSAASYRRFASFLSSTLDASSHSTTEAAPNSSIPTVKAPTPPPPSPPPDFASVQSWDHHPEYKRWKDKEDEILKDIESITLLTKEILHSDRYMDGERLSADDEKEVVEKLLAYHPHSEDKIGCGFDHIMVDCHPTFRNSRCLFVVRTDGGWIDFSYQKCLRAYIRDKYPSHAEKFIREHFKRI